MAVPSPPLPSPSLGIIQGHPSCRWCLEVGAGHEAGWAQHPSCAELGSFPSSAEDKISYKAAKTMQLEVSRLLYLAVDFHSFFYTVH